MNNKTLSIKELALLKTNPQDYYLTKTHDGTSLGKIPINEFVSKYSGDFQYHEAIYDKNGNIIEELHDLSSTIVYHKSTKEDRIDSHVIMSYDANEKDMVYHELEDGTAWLGVEELYPIAEHDSWKGEYGVGECRSVTLVGGNGSSMTVIKNNKFSNEDVEKLYGVSDDFSRAIEDYFIDGKNPTMNMQEFIKENGWDKKFEECNVKLRFQKNTQYANEYDVVKNMKEWKDEYSDYIEWGGEPIIGTDEYANYYYDEPYNY